MAPADPVLAFAAECGASGFDVVHPFAVAWWNAGVPPAHRLPDFGRAGALGLLVGNTRAMWPHFTKAHATRPDLRASPHPLDQWTAEVVGRATERLGAERAVRWTHDVAPAFPFQRLAAAVGLAVLSPSHLVVHASYGPWLALRAVVTVNVPGPPGAAPAAPDPCARCSKPCVAALESAIRETGGGPAAEVERAWELWARVREVCPEGASHRYTGAQLRYHYAKDRSVLDE